MLLWQVQAHIVKLRRQLSMIDGHPAQSKAASGQWFSLEFSCNQSITDHHLVATSQSYIFSVLLIFLPFLLFKERSCVQVRGRREQNECHVLCACYVWISETGFILGWKVLLVFLSWDLNTSCELQALMFYELWVSLKQMTSVHSDGVFANSCVGG